MSEGEQTLRRIDWSECFAFTRLFRAFRIAVQPTKLGLALCGLIATFIVGRGLDNVSMSQSRPAAVFDASGQVLQSELDVFIAAASGDRTAATSKWIESLGKPEDVHRVGVFSVLIRQGRVLASTGTDALLAADCPRAINVASTALLTKAWLIRMHPLYALFLSVAVLAIWGLFGGAICRAAALQTARDEVAGPRDAIAFARNRFWSFVFAPILPSLILLVAGALLWLGGWIGAIPAVGDIAVGLLFFLALIAGFGMAFVFIGAIAGGALMFPTIAAEGSDAGDALARSFSYVYGRPWRTGFYYVVSLAYGMLCFLFVKWVARIMLVLVHLFVGASMNFGSAVVTTEGGAARSAPDKLTAIWQAPTLTPDTPFWGSFNHINLAGTSWLAQVFIKGWIYLVAALVAAFMVSFAYSASTLIYFLLRREVDATDLEDVYIEDYDAEPTAPAPSTSPDAPPDTGDTSLPVVGQ